MPGYQLYALRAALEPCRPPPRQISANGIAAARDGMSGVTGFRVVRVCHRVISNLAASRVWFRLLFCHHPFRHEPH